MDVFISNTNTLVGSLTSFAYFLPLVWGLFIVTEWLSQNRYYNYFHIDHSFKINYQIVFNPRYVLSLILTLFLMLFIFLVMQINNWIIFIGGFVFCIDWCIISSYIRSNRKEKMNDLYNEPSENTVEKYRELNTKWLSTDNDVKILVCIAIIWFVGGLFAFPGINDLLTVQTLFPNLKNNLSNSLQEVGGIRPIAFLIWLLISSVSTHYVFNIFSNTHMISRELVDYFRVIIREHNTYVLLAPTSTDKNEICVAVKTYICRKKNGIVVGYLILDDVITESAPLEGESFLVGVDMVRRILPENYQSALLDKNRINEILISDGMNEYLKYDKTWLDLVSSKNSKTIQLRKNSYLYSIKLVKS